MATDCKADARAIFGGWVGARPTAVGSVYSVKVCSVRLHNSDLVDVNCDGME